MKDDLKSAAHSKNNNLTHTCCCCPLDSLINSGALKKKLEGIGLLNKKLFNNRGDDDEITCFFFVRQN